jgi:Domain of unknown function (DUF4136)
VKPLVIIILILLGTTSANAQKVKVEADPKADLTKYKTYSWAQGQSMANPLIQQIIIENVDRAMTAKGLTKVQTDPDLTVVAWAATESDMHISYPSWEKSMGSINTGIAAGASAWPVTKGTMVVDITDAKTKNGVWRAKATDTLEHGPSGSAAKDAKSVEKKITKAVDKMFKKYPRP